MKKNAENAIMGIHLFSFLNFNDATIRKRKIKPDTTVTSLLIYSTQDETY